MRTTPVLAKTYLLPSSFARNLLYLFIKEVTSKYMTSYQEPGTRGDP